MSTERVVHVIDDDDAVRDSLAFLLASAGLAVTKHDSAVAFLAALPGLAAGCVITDIRMPGMTGIDLLKRLKGAGNPMPVIVVTGHGDVPLAVEAMKLGASEFLEKPFDDDQMLAAVATALNRHEQDDERAAREADVRARLASLSQREREVLDGLVAGNANKVIAHDLGISPRTVEVYRANVMTKMKAQSLSELVRMALTAGEQPG